MEPRIKETLEKAIEAAHQIESAIKGAVDDAEQHGAQDAGIALYTAQIAMENLRESLEQLIYHEKIGLL